MERPSQQSSDKHTEENLHLYFPPLGSEPIDTQIIFQDDVTYNTAYREREQDMQFLHPYQLLSNVVVLKGQKLLPVDGRIRPRLAQLIRNGELDERFVRKLAYAQYLFNSRQQSQYTDVLQAAEEVTGGIPDEVPPPSAPLEQRLAWTLKGLPVREELARAKRQEATDKIRGTLIPRYDTHGLDFVTQVRLIHRKHMKGNEHLILTPAQARSILLVHIGQIDRLGGKIRSNQDLTANIAIHGTIAPSASYPNTPYLLNQLGRVADELFPPGNLNPRVTEESIYYYNALIQLYYALIHPTMEGNGRVSEDLQYVLWQRRPDLAHTVRYVSADGFREGKAVDAQMEIINRIALGYVKYVGKLCGAPDDQLEYCTNYADVVTAVKQANPYSEATMERVYRRLYDHELGRGIKRIPDWERERQHLSLNLLVENIKNASPTYTLADGTVLGNQRV